MAHCRRDIESWRDGSAYRPPRRRGFGDEGLRGSSFETDDAEKAPGTDVGGAEPG